MDTIVVLMAFAQAGLGGISIPIRHAFEQDERLFLAK
jgi:hypothetical protein